MNPALVISKREIRTYFNSPVAYIVVTVFMCITGYLFFTQLFLEKQADCLLFGAREANEKRKTRRGHQKGERSGSRLRLTLLFPWRRP